MTAGPEERAAALADLERVALVCTKCELAEGRTQVVFGAGHPDADLMIVGEGPGQREDEQGIPFVGPSGKLMETLLGEIGLDRADAYIANVVKCRPPGNRDPKEDEVAACAAYLDRQIDLIKPKVIVALGKPASRRLTGTNKPMGALRGRWSSYRGVPLMPTFHSAYLLRTPKAKREVWEDLKLVMRRLASTADE